MIRDEGRKVTRNGQRKAADYNVDAGLHHKARFTSWKQPRRRVRTASFQVCGDIYPISLYLSLTLLVSWLLAPLARSGEEKNTVTSPTTILTPRISSFFFNDIILK